MKELIGRELWVSPDLKGVVVSIKNGIVYGNIGSNDSMTFRINLSIIIDMNKDVAREIKLKQLDI